MEQIGRHLFMWEEELLVSLKEDLEGVVWSHDEDEWWWNVEDNGIFRLNRLMISWSVWCWVRVFGI
jgi:hypothetical protein